MLLSLSHCSRIHHTLKHVKIRSDATRGFIATLGSVADGMCKSSFLATVKAAHISHAMRQGESTARWVDELTTKAVKYTS